MKLPPLVSKNCASEHSQFAHNDQIARSKSHDQRIMDPYDETIRKVQKQLSPLKCRAPIPLYPVSPLKIIDPTKIKHIKRKSFENGINSNAIQEALVHQDTGFEHL